MGMLGTLVVMGMFLTSVLLVVSGFVFWVDLILLFYFYNFELWFRFWNQNNYCNFYPFLPPVIQSRWVFCCPRTMVPYHRHHGLLLLFVFFIVVTSWMSAPTCFWSPIPLLVLLCNIIHRIFTSAMALYHYRRGLLLFLLFFTVVATHMIAATSFDRQFHQKYVLVNILKCLFPSAMAIYHRRRGLLLFLFFLVVFTSCMSATTCFDFWFRWKYFPVTYSTLFFPAQWHFITVAVGFFIIFTSWMIVTTRFDCAFHQNYFAVTYFSVFFPSQCRFIIVAVIYCCCFRFL